MEQISEKDAPQGRGICRLAVSQECSVEEQMGCRHAIEHDMGVDCMIDCGSESADCNCKAVEPMSEPVPDLSGADDEVEDED